MEIFLCQGLEVCGTPAMTAFSVRSCDSQVSIFAVADVMEKNGTLHFCVQTLVSRKASSTVVCMYVCMYVCRLDDGETDG